MIAIKRGEVWWIDFNPSIAGEVQKTRPAIIVSNDFANEIFHQNGVSIDLKPIRTSAYPTPAKRPAYSVLDKTKIKSTFDIEIKEWQMSLATCINQL